MYKREVSHSDTEISVNSWQDISKKRAVSIASEGRFLQQDSFVSIRSRRSSSSKYDLPNYVSFRSKSSLSLHLLDVCHQDFERLCQNITPDFSYIKLNDNMSEFLNYWTDPIFRLYFLLFLSYYNHQTLFFLEYELSKIAVEYHLQSTTTRPLIAKSIYTQYLSTTSFALVKFSSEPRSPSPAKVIRYLKQSSSSSSPSLFNDLHLLVYETLSKHFHGEFIDFDEVVFAGPVTKRPKFKDSVFFQIKYRRIGERLLMMRSNGPIDQYPLYTKILEAYQFNLISGIEKMPTMSSIVSANDDILSDVYAGKQTQLCTNEHDFTQAKEVGICETCFVNDRDISDPIYECTKCYIYSHESCRKNVRNCCFPDNSPKYQMSPTVEKEKGNHIDKPKSETNPKESETEGIANTTDLVSNMTLNDRLEEKLEEVMTEIIDSELKYTEDMKMTTKIFIKPLKKLGVIEEELIKDIFSNLESIVNLHQDISSMLREIQNDSDTLLKLEKLIAVYEMNADEFYLYKIYCSNQSNSSRTLKSLAERENFQEFISNGERNPLLCKLKLSDLLVKPMHRITRYGLLLKRLLSYVSTQSTSHESLNRLIDFFTTSIKEIDNAVQVENSIFSLKNYDRKLESGHLAEKFSLQNNYRHLVGELNCSYVKIRNELSEITLSLFSDILLILKQRKSGLHLYREPILLESLLLIDYSSKDMDERQFSIIHIGKGMHTFLAPSAKEKIAWIKTLEFHRSEFVKILRHRELQLFQISQPVPLPSFDDQLCFDSDSSSSVSNANTSRKPTFNSENHINVLEKVEEEDGERHSLLQRSKSSRRSLHSSISEISKHLSIDGIAFMKRWSSLTKSKASKKMGE